MPTLKANIGGVWTPISSGAGGGAEEVFIGPSEPTDPAIELWVDSDAVSNPSIPTSGLESAKPATPTQPGMRYFATDTKRDWLWDGTGWIIMGEPAQPHTPTLTNVTIGNGVFSGNTSQRSDGYCTVRWTFTLGTTSAVIGQIMFTLPYPPHADMQVNELTVTSRIPGSYTPLMHNNVQPVQTWAMNASGTYVAMTATSATVPFTWASAYDIRCVGSYPMSSRYT